MNTRPLAPELLAIKAAYTAIERLDTDARSRALSWLAERIDADEREASAKVAAGTIKPEVWCETGHLPDYSDSAQEIIDECGHYGEVLAIDGYGVVERRYAVPFQIGDVEGNVEDNDVEFFDTRERAEAFAQSLTEAPEPLSVPDEAPVAPLWGVPPEALRAAVVRVADLLARKHVELPAEVLAVFGRLGIVYNNPESPK